MARPKKIVTETVGNKLPLAERFPQLLAQLNQSLYEREQILAIALLGAIAGQNTFLLGPPGTAKSLISRRLACAFEKPNYFEYLMNRFSTPEEIFGPISIKALKEDRYIRQIEGYLPTADFAFLDEIWKASPAILNNLLTIINEKVFKNGNDKIGVPLKSLIAASNEIPEEDQGLEALYDRFILRLFVKPIERKVHFNYLLENVGSTESVEIDPQLRIDYQELARWQKDIQQVKLSKETIKVIHVIRENLAKKENEDDEYEPVYISDRRWGKVAYLLKAAAYCCGRTETKIIDLTLLKYCLWSDEENRLAIEKRIDKALFEYQENQDIFENLINEKKEIEQLFFMDRSVTNATIIPGNNHIIVRDRLIDRDNSLKRYAFRILTSYKDLMEEGQFIPKNDLMVPYDDYYCEIVYDKGDDDFICKWLVVNSTQENTLPCKILLVRKKLNFISKRFFQAKSKFSFLKARLEKIKSELIYLAKPIDEKIKENYSPFVEKSEKYMIENNNIFEINKEIKDCERLLFLCN